MCVKIQIISPFYILKHRRLNSWVIWAILDYLLISNLMFLSTRGITWHGCCHLFPFPLPHSEEDSLVAMLRFQEFERSTVDTEGAMGLAAILAGQIPELRGKKWVRHSLLGKFSSCLYILNCQKSGADIIDKALHHVSRRSKVSLCGLIFECKKTQGSF